MEDMLPYSLHSNSYCGRNQARLPACLCEGLVVAGSRVSNIVRSITIWILFRKRRKKGLWEHETHWYPKQPVPGVPRRNKLLTKGFPPDVSIRNQCSVTQFMEIRNDDNQLLLHLTFLLCRLAFLFRLATRAYITACSERTGSSGSGAAQAIGNNELQRAFSVVFCLQRPQHWIWREVRIYKNIKLTI